MVYINKDTEDIKLENTIVSLGNFDGLHIGHQLLIKECLSRALKNNLYSVVFSFYPHPRQVIYNKEIKLLLTSQEKKYLLSKMAIDYFIEYPFDTLFANLSPQEFFNNIIVKKLNCKALVVGKGYKFGKLKEGSAETLYDLCKQNKITLVEMSHLMMKNEKVSSSHIRDLILNNNFADAKKYLTRDYFLISNIITISKINNNLAIKVSVPTNKLIPNDGVYLICIEVGSTILEGVAHINHYKDTLNILIKANKNIEINFTSIKIIFKNNI